MAGDGERRQYDQVFKREAVRLSHDPDRTVAQVARDLGISEKNLWRWRKKLAEGAESAFPGTGHQSPEQEELRRLRRQLADVTEERDILKKALAVFSRRRE
jgi:transposase